MAENMIIRALVPRWLPNAGDWTFGQGMSNFLTGDAAVAEAIQVALQIFRGEVFWYTNYGVDWNNILGAVGAQRVMNILVVQAREVILGVQGVVSVNNLYAEVDPITRQVTLQYTVTTENGGVVNFTSAPDGLVLPVYSNPIPL
jgi:hypothetical protein